MSYEPKTCPFCNGEASRIAARQRDDGTYYPARCGCYKCGVWRYGESNYGHGGFATKEDLEASMEQAVSKWNTRVPESDSDKWKTKYKTYKIAYEQANAERKRYSEQIDKLFADVKRWKDAANEQRLAAMEQADKVAELTAERGECEIIGCYMNNLMYPDYATKWYELSCGHSLTLKGGELPNYCPVCGSKTRVTRF